MAKEEKKAEEEKAEREGLKNYKNAFCSHFGFSKKELNKALKGENKEK